MPFCAGPVLLYCYDLFANLLDSGYAKYIAFVFELVKFCLGPGVFIVYNNRVGD
jgi:hypothetical protein